MLAELDDLVLLQPFEAMDDDDDTVTLPEGATGTVVSVLGGGKGYTVEFERPVHALIELSSEHIRGIGGDSREHLAARLSR